MSTEKADNKKAFLAAMAKTFGNITQSVQACGLSRVMPYTWEKDDEKFKAEFRGTQWGEMFKDMVESQLTALAIKKNATVLIFLAKTKLKDRGYIESHRIEYTNDTPTPVSREEVEESIKKISAMMEGKLTVTKKTA